MKRLTKKSYWTYLIKKWYTFLKYWYIQKLWDLCPPGHYALFTHFKIMLWPTSFSKKREVTLRHLCKKRYKFKFNFNIRENRHNAIEKHVLSSIWNPCFCCLNATISNKYGCTMKRISLVFDIVQRQWTFTYSPVPA